MIYLDTYSPATALDPLNHKVLRADVMSSREKSRKETTTYIQRNRSSTFQLNKPCNSSNRHFSGAAADWKSQREFLDRGPKKCVLHDDSLGLLLGHVSSLILSLVVALVRLWGLLEKDWALLSNYLRVFEPGDSNRLALAHLQTSYRPYWKPQGCVKHEP